VSVGVGVSVIVGDGVTVAVGVIVGVSVTVGVAVRVGVSVGVAVSVGVGVGVARSAARGWQAAVRRPAARIVNPIADLARLRLIPTLPPTHAACPSGFYGGDREEAMCRLD
jgi:hypothetical protein